MQIRREAEAVRRAADIKVAASDAAMLCAAEHTADMTERLGMPAVEVNYAGLLSPGRAKRLKR